MTDGALVTHRSDAVLPDGTYRTKGDANRSPDSTPIAPGDVVRQGRMLVPFIALPVAWAVDGAWTSADSLEVTATTPNLCVL